MASCNEYDPFLEPQENDVIYFSGGVALSCEDLSDELGAVADPERFPVTLGQLNVVNTDRIRAKVTGPRHGTVWVRLLPTVPHCHLMLLIALSVRVKLLESLPPLVHWKVFISLVPGSHVDEIAISKQINDKERALAALEQPHIATQVKRLVNPYADVV